jgi:hypothetical protein
MDTKSSQVLSQKQPSLEAKIDKNAVTLSIDEDIYRAEITLANTRCGNAGGSKKFEEYERQAAITVGDLSGFWRITGKVLSCCAQST